MKRTPRSRRAAKRRARRTRVRRSRMLRRRSEQRRPRRRWISTIRISIARPRLLKSCKSCRIKLKRKLMSYRDFLRERRQS